MRKHLFLFLVLACMLAALGSAALLLRSPDAAHAPQKEPQPPSPTEPSEETPPSEQTKSDTGNVEDSPKDLPLVRAEERVTKKPFGIYITPETSPVDPERFSGYHTGTDYEMLPGEATSDASVFAICDGEILEKRIVSGYGGVIIQSCRYEGAPVTVLYGHLDISASEQTIGDMVRAGDAIAILGEGYSPETDGERKHLHLAIHRGPSLEYRGYVRSESELSRWIDPEIFLNTPLR